MISDICFTRTCMEIRSKPDPEIVFADIPLRVRLAQRGDRAPYLKTACGFESRFLNAILITRSGWHLVTTTKTSAPGRPQKPDFPPPALLVYEAHNESRLGKKQVDRFLNTVLSEKNIFSVIFGCDIIN